MAEQTHVSFLLRIWRPNTRSPWHVTVVDVAQPDERQHFATLDALFAFLTAQTGPAPVAEQMSASNDGELDHYTSGGVL